MQLTAIQGELRQLITRHCATLGREAGALESALESLYEADGDPFLAMQAAAGHAHKIKGSSGTIGFMPVSEKAKVLEQLLRGMQNDLTMLTEGNLEMAHKLCADLNQTVARLQPTDSTLYYSGLA